ncbi:MAG: nitroreductase family deazaflavin-dependent oxidoreductase [Chloroflexota bacterium]|nr:nitroreductase family deazaflavin-dependent oxidoreductase [Chloroflexota bacterium]
MAAIEAMSDIGALFLRGIMRLLGASPRALREFIRLISVLHMFVYRSTGGSLTGRLGLRNARMILLSTTGRKSGKERTIPLLSIKDGHDWVVIASHGGLDQPPAWWLNLMTNPEAVVHVGRRTMKVRAEQADPNRRSRLWPRFVRAFGGYEDYRRRTTRELPIMILHPIEGTGGKRHANV